MADDTIGSNIEAVRAHIVAEYKNSMLHHDNPKDGLACVIAAMIELVIDYTATGRQIPHTFIIVLGDVARWWGLANEGKPLPEDLL